MAQDTRVKIICTGSDLQNDDYNGYENDILSQKIIIKKTRK